MDSPCSIVQSGECCAGSVRGSQVSGDQARVRSTSASSAAPIPVDSESGNVTALGQPGPHTASQDPWRSWSNLWQIPALILGAALIGYGLYQASGKAAVIDIPAELAKVEELIASGEYKSAATAIREKIDPAIKHAAAQEQSRYHANVADLVYLSQQAEGLSELQNYQQVVDHFASAVKHGADIHPRQVERWLESLLALGELAAVRERLADLDSIESDRLSGDDALELRAIRNRIFRRWVEAGLRSDDASFEELSELLAEYRRDQALPLEDELWAVARQAQLRLESGMSQQAVDFLLVEMRRLEARSSSEAPIPVGELYGLLGRGYFELGDYDRAQTLLEQALAMFHAPVPPMGDALVLLGQIAATRGQPDLALEKYQIVVRDFPATASYLPGLLGLAEMHSVLGEHETSFEQFRRVQHELAHAAYRREVTPGRIAESLCDRHDAALAMGKLDTALEYALIAEQFFGPDQAPSEVLFRVASTSRQMAENLVGGAARPGEDASASRRLIDPALRLECNRLFEQSGEYFIRHSNAERSSTQSEEQWATSLWMAADSYDLGGRVDLAIKHFLNYLDRRPIDDPRRAETLFRLARAHHSQLDYERAISYYEQVVADRARTTFAAQSYVPLARCLIAVDRQPEAIAQLRQVLSGDRLLKPDARDYRDALIELGRTSYQGSDFAGAIEQFTEAMLRYPDDSQRLEIMFLLADSHRGNAMSIVERLNAEPVMSASEQARLKSLRDSQLQAAQDMFASVCDAYSKSTSGSLGSFELDQLRQAQLYRADCAFHLGRFQQAIEIYDQVTRQYSAHHSSMYALIQIVNSYRAIGDHAKSEAAHRRALARLSQLPDNAFAAPDSLMDRAAWERWLENVPLTQSQTAAVDADAG